jgi:hypothetical protein
MVVSKTLPRLSNPGGPAGPVHDVIKIVKKSARGVNNFFMI